MSGLIISQEKPRRLGNFLLFTSLFIISSVVGLPIVAQLDWFTRIFTLAKWAAMLLFALFLVRLKLANELKSAEETITKLKAEKESELADIKKSNADKV